MLRLVYYLLLAVLLITVLRSFIGLALRAVAKLLEPSGPRGQQPAQTAGELRRDPVCGVYVSTETAVRLSEGGKVLYFCSTGCRDRYKKGERAPSA